MRRPSAAGLREDDSTWGGDPPHTEVSRFLSSCDLMILPFVDGVSTARSKGVTALRHGLPLLTTYGTKLEAEFVHGVNAYSVPIRDRQGLADGLLELAANPEFRARIGEGVHALGKTQFTWDVVAKQVLRRTPDRLTSWGREARVCVLRS